MPGVIGCIDCTHVAIRSPRGQDAERFSCRKVYFSLHVQALCDADLKFTRIVASWPGSTHDSRILENSNICHILEQGQYPGYLLGDGGYPCRRYLLTPIPSPAPGKEKRFNLSHARTRSAIERAFGVLKRRFYCLGQTLRTKLSTSRAIIMACAVLHNIAISSRIPITEEDADIPVDAEEEVEHDMNDLARMGFQLRNSIVNQWF